MNLNIPVRGSRILLKQDLTVQSNRLTFSKGSWWAKVKNTEGESIVIPAGHILTIERLHIDGNAYFTANAGINGAARTSFEVGNSPIEKLALVETKYVNDDGNYRPIEFPVTRTNADIYLSDITVDVEFLPPQFVQFSSVELSEQSEVRWWHRNVGVTRAKNRANTIFGKLGYNKTIHVRVNANDNSVVIYDPAVDMPTFNSWQDRDAFHAKINARIMELFN